MTKDDLTFQLGSYLQVLTCIGKDMLNTPQDAKLVCLLNDFERIFCRAQGSRSLTITQHAKFVHLLKGVLGRVEEM